MTAQDTSLAARIKLTSTLLVLCKRSERALSKVDLPAPGGPSSRVNLPGCRTVLMVSRIVKRCEVSLVKRVLRSTPYKTADRLMVSQRAEYM